MPMREFDCSSIEFIQIVFNFLLQVFIEDRNFISRLELPETLVRKKWLKPPEIFNIFS